MTIRQAQAEPAGLTPAASSRPALWLYVSTIGELHSIEPVLAAVLAWRPDLDLVLMTDHPHYRDSYMRLYPRAAFWVVSGDPREARALRRRHPPKVFIVAEIPAVMHDAPCRLPAAFALQAKDAGATVVLVNGWLYGHAPSCRMDHVESWLLARDYVRAFDVICMQTPEGRDIVVKAGADPERVHALGNLKFDAIDRPPAPPDDANLAQVLQALRESDRPIIVGGCVTNLDEQQFFLDAMVALRKLRPNALLVLAPRHPEVAERMVALRQYLAERALQASFRSRVNPSWTPADTHCLVLDTLGELRHFYAAATVTHVGINHNTLEPMMFGKAVTVTGDWNPGASAYRVYRLLLDSGVLHEARSPVTLAEAWHRLIRESDLGASDPRPRLAPLRGGLERQLTCIRPWLDRAAS